MSSQAFFCYEFLHGSIPTPVIYYDSIPQKYAKENNIRREKITDVSHLPIGPDHELSISTLVRMYPYLTKETSTIIVDNKETKKMSQAVTGYLTRNGQFFPTKAKADFYDAYTDLMASATEAVGNLGIEDETHIKVLVEGFKAFLEEETELILEFITTKRMVENEEKQTARVDGPATGDNPSPDTSVRATASDEEVVEPTTAEVKSSPVGSVSKYSKSNSNK